MAKKRRRCKNCGAVYSAKRPACPVCGSTSSRPVRRGGKLLLTVLAVLLALAAIGWAAVTWLVPAAHYLLGGRRYSKGDYAGAVAEYTAAGDFRDAEDRLILAKKAEHFAKGEALAAEGKLYAAVEEFRLAEDFPNAAQRILDCYNEVGDRYFADGGYVQAAAEYVKGENRDGVFRSGMALLDQSEYEDAAGVFHLLGDEEGGRYEAYSNGRLMLSGGESETAVGFLKEAQGVLDAEDLRKEASYLTGEEYLKQNDYDTAMGWYREAKDYPGAENKVMACGLLQANECFLAGRLHAAKTLYEQLPADFTYEGLSVAEHLDILTANAAFVDLCGTWGAGSGTVSVTKESKQGNGITWKGSYTEPEVQLEILCTVNEDGSVTLSGTVSLYAITAFAQKGEDLPVEKRTEQFCKTVTEVPEMIEVSDVLRLTASGGVNKVRYREQHSKNGNTYTFTSDFVYDRMLEEY